MRKAVDFKHPDGTPVFQIKDDPEKHKLSCAPPYVEAPKFTSTPHEWEVLEEHHDDNILEKAIPKLLEKGGAIEGPAGSGKSTATRAILKEIERQERAPLC